MPQLFRLRCFTFNRALHRKLPRSLNGDVECFVEQQKLRYNFFGREECRPDKHAIIYDAFLHNYAFFELRTADRLLSGQLRTNYCNSGLYSAREPFRIGSRVGGSRNQKGSRSRSLFDRLHLPGEFWSLAAIWAGGVQLGTLFYVGSVRCERRKYSEDASNQEHSSLLSFSAWRPLTAHLCVWPICSTVKCMRDASSSGDRIRAKESRVNSIALADKPAEQWIQDPASKKNKPTATLRRIPTIPEFHRLPFEFRFDEAACAYLDETATKFRRNRDAISTQTSGSQSKAAGLRSHSVERLILKSNSIQLSDSWRPITDENSTIELPELVIPSPPPTPQLYERLPVGVADNSFRSAQRVNSIVEDFEYDLDSVESHSVSSEIHSSESESDIASLESDEDTYEMRFALFSPAAEFKPLDPIDIQLSPLLDSLSRNAARSELTRAVAAAHHLLSIATPNSATPPEYSTGIADKSRNCLLRAVSSSCKVGGDTDDDGSYDGVCRAFALAAHHAEQACDYIMRSRIYFNEAVFHELADRSGFGLSGSRGGVPESLHRAVQCYLEALESDRRNVQAAGNLASLCWLISNQPTVQAARRRAYSRRAQKYAKVAVKLGDNNAKKILETAEQVENGSDSETEQRVSA